MSKAFPSKFSNKDNVVGQTIHTMCVTNKSIVPHKFDSLLNNLLSISQTTVKKMLADRSKSSSKDYPELPSVIAKSLIVKYQKNKKCKAVKSLAMQICGDKGKQVKLESNNAIRIPCITKKETIAIQPLKPIVGYIRSIEFFKRKGNWYLSYSYNTPINPVEVNGVIGIDRNARDNVATLADPSTGFVKRIGQDVKLWKDNLKRRKANLQRQGAKPLLVKINRKQSNRTKDINHKVSKEIVNYAVTHRKAIALENLGKIKNSKKCGRFVQKSNWSFYQLEQYIKYKASLHGIPVIYVDPAFTSKTCSKCGSINDVNGKNFVCKDCGHKDHRDSNAGFNIGLRAMELPATKESYRRGLLTIPKPVKEKLDGN